MIMKENYNKQSITRKTQLSLLTRFYHSILIPSGCHFLKNQKHFRGDSYYLSCRCSLGHSEEGFCNRQHRQTCSASTVFTSWLYAGRQPTLTKHTAAILAPAPGSERTFHEVFFMEGTFPWSVFVVRKKTWTGKDVAEMFKSSLFANITRRVTRHTTTCIFVCLPGLFDFITLFSYSNFSRKHGCVTNTFTNRWRLLKTNAGSR